MLFYSYLRLPVPGLQWRARILTALGAHQGPTEKRTGHLQSTRLTKLILIGLVLGVCLGLLVFHSYPQQSAAFASGADLLPSIFLRMIKMIIAPLVFSTLVVGIAKMGDVGTVGRVGIKAFGWFVFASLISLT